jgi:hypothetical protein
MVWHLFAFLPFEGHNKSRKYQTVTCINPMWYTFRQMTDYQIPVPSHTWPTGSILQKIPAFSATAQRKNAKIFQYCVPKNLKANVTPIVLGATRLTHGAETSSAEGPTGSSEDDNKTHLRKAWFWNKGWRMKSKTKIVTYNVFTPFFLHLSIYKKYTPNWCKGEVLTFLLRGYTVRILTRQPDIPTTDLLGSYYFL